MVHGKRRQKLIQNILSRIEINPGLNSCWEWQGALNPKGYAHVCWKGLPTQGHRACYILFRGEIPEGKEIDHLCGNRSCIHPWHMEAVDHRVNILRGNTLAAKQLKQRHCKRGHSLEDAISRRGNRRECRTCYELYKARKRLFGNAAR